MTFNQAQKDLVFGTLLGDGSLQTLTAGKTWRYRAIHKKEHAEYLTHKYTILQGYCTTGPIEGEVFDERTGKTYFRSYFNTNVHQDFRLFGNMFYGYNSQIGKMVKHVPTNQLLNKYLTPAALAYLYMDDGALKWKDNSNAMRICTESFNTEDVKRISKVLTEKYNLKTRVNKDNRLFIPEDQSSTFRELIKPHLVDCMKYKVSDGQKGHL